MNLNAIKIIFLYKKSLGNYFFCQIISFMRYKFRLYMVQNLNLEIFYEMIINIFTCF